MKNAWPKNLGVDAEELFDDLVAFSAWGTRSDLAALLVARFKGSDLKLKVP